MKRMYASVAHNHPTTSLLLITLIGLNASLCSSAPPRRRQLSPVPMLAGWLAPSYQLPQGYAPIPAIILAPYGPLTVPAGYLPNAGAADSGAQPSAKQISLAKTLRAMQRKSPGKDQSADQATGPSDTGPSFIERLKDQVAFAKQKIMEAYEALENLSRQIPASFTGDQQGPSTSVGGPVKGAQEPAQASQYELPLMLSNRSNNEQVSQPETKLASSTSEMATLSVPQPDKQGGECQESQAKPVDESVSEAQAATGSNPVSDEIPRLEAPSTGKLEVQTYVAENGGSQETENQVESHEGSKVSAEGTHDASAFKEPQAASLEAGVQTSSSSAEPIVSVQERKPVSVQNELPVLSVGQQVVAPPEVDHTGTGSAPAFSTSSSPLAVTTQTVTSSITGQTEGDPPTVAPSAFAHSQAAQSSLTELMSNELKVGGPAPPTSSSPSPSSATSDSAARKFAFQDLLSPQVDPANRAAPEPVLSPASSAALVATAKPAELVRPTAGGGGGYEAPQAAISFKTPPPSTNARAASAVPVRPVSQQGNALEELHQRFGKVRRPAERVRDGRSIISDAVKKVRHHSEPRIRYAIDQGRDTIDYVAPGIHNRRHRQHQHQVQRSQSLARLPAVRSEAFPRDGLYRSSGLQWPAAGFQRRPVAVAPPPSATPPHMQIGPAEGPIAPMASSADAARSYESSSSGATSVRTPDGGVSRSQFELAESQRVQHGANTFKRSKSFSSSSSSYSHSSCDDEC